MRRIFLLALLSISAALYSESSEMQPWSITRGRSSREWSSVFDCKKGDELTGRVVRTGFLQPRYQYDLQNTRGELEVRAITRIFSWGLIFPWGIEMDLYDANTQIGMIGGSLLTLSRAKFTFYNAQGEETAVAYLNTDSSEFVIVSAKQEETILAELKGRSFGSLNIWEMKPVRANHGIDERMFKIFVAFAADFHNSFMPVREVNYNYYDNRNRSSGISY